MKKEFVLTADGSHSIYLPEIDEHYHSIHGAIAESQHVFIQSGLIEVAKKKDHIAILEVGMGTGLNVLMTALNTAKKDISIFYDAVEAFPIKEEDWMKLNYAAQLKEQQATELYQAIHEQAWEEITILQKEFQLRKTEIEIQNFEFTRQYDLVYFDAFAPEKQAEMWDKGLFELLYKAMNEGGLLLTYCVKGVVRRTLQSVGFEIEKLPGPIGGKREILRARK